MKKIISLILTLALFLPLFSGIAETAEVFEFDDRKQEITQYNGEGASLVIPSELKGLPVLAVGSRGISDNNVLTDIVFPDTVQVLSNGVLYYVRQLTSVTLSQDLRVIGDYNFYSCESLEKVTIPAGVSYIGYNAFEYCEKLKEIVFEGKAPVIGENSFWDLADDAVVYVPDDELESYRAVIPEDIEVRASGRKCVSVNQVEDESKFDFDAATGTITAYHGNLICMEIPSSIGGVPVKHIGDGVFADMRNLTIVIIPEGVESVGTDAFSYATALVWVDMPSTMKTIGDGAFRRYCGNMFDFNEGLESIGSNAFASNGMRNPLVLPEGLKTVGDGAFLEGTYITEVYFPTTIEKIGENAFAGYDFFKTYVKYAAFAGSEMPEMSENSFHFESLADVDINWQATREEWEKACAVFEALGATSTTVWRNNPTSAGVAEFIGRNVCTSWKYENGLLISCETDHPDLSVYSSTSDADGVSTDIYGLGDGVFKGSQTIRSFYPHHCGWFTTIGNEAFADSTLEYVELFDTITTIGAGAFRNCVNMKELVIPDSVTEIGEGAFEGLTGLETVVVKCDASCLPEKAFSGLLNLKNVTFEKGAVPNGICENTGLENLSLGEGVTSLGEDAFAHTQISSAVIPASCALVAPTAFDGVPAENIRLSADASDEQVASVSEALGFKWSAPIARVGESNELIRMPDEPSDESLFEFDASTGTIRAWNGTDPDVVIPREIGGVTVRAIARNAFDACRDYTGTEIITNKTKWVPLRSVVIPETVEVIEDGAFEYCQQLQLFVCYGALETSGRGVFEYCTNLETAAYVNSVRMLDNYLFENCPSLERVYYGNRLETVGYRAFALCGITSLVIDAKNVSNWAVYDCPNLSEISFTKRVQSVEAGAVCKCPELTLVCIENDNLEFLPKDGAMAEIGAEITTIVPDTISDEMLSETRRILMWSMTPSKNEVVKEAYSCPEAVCPDFSAIILDEVDVPFSMEPDSVVEYDITPVDAATAQAYLGKWNGLSMEMDGYVMNLADMGITVEVEFVNESTVNMVLSGEAEVNAWYFANGEMYVGYGDPAEDMTVTLNADGTLTLSQYGSSMLLARDGAEVSLESNVHPVDADTALLYAGTWNGLEMAMDGSAIALSDLEAEMTFELFADGTAVQTMYGETETFRWYESDGQIYMGIGVPGADMVLSLDEEGYLHIEQDSYGLKLERTDAPVEIPVTVSSNEAGADFLGKWVGLSMEMDGYSMNLADLGMTMDVEFYEGGKATLTVYGEAVDGAWYEEDGEIYVTGDADEKMLLTVNEDGTISLSEDGSNLILAREGASVSVESNISAPDAETAKLIAGKWNGVEMDMDGTVMDLKESEIEVSFEFFEDGSAIETMYGSTDSFRWYESNGQLYMGLGVPDIDMTLTLDEDGYLHVEQDGYGFKLERENATVQITAQVPEDLTENDFLGKWVGLSMEMDGYSMNLADFGMTVEAEFFEGGKATLTTYGEAVDGTWYEENGEIYVTDADEKMLLTVNEDGTISLSEDGSNLIFAREGASVSVESSVSAPDADTAKLYAGVWNGTEMDMDGFAIPLSDWGIVVTLELNEDGSAWQTMDDEQQPMRWYVSEGTAYVGVGVPAYDMTMTLCEDGKLIVTGEGVNLTYEREGTEVETPVEPTGVTPLEEPDFDAAPYLGEWLGVSMEVDGDLIELAGLGMEIRFEIKDDGTALLTSFDGEETEGAWQIVNGKMIFTSEGTEDSEIVLNEDGTLTMLEEGASLLLAREGSELLPEKTEMDIDAEVAAKYLGLWNGIQMVMDDVPMDLSEWGVEITVEFFADGTVSQTMYGDTETMRWYETDGQVFVGIGMPSMDMTATVNDNGSLTLAQEGYSLLFAREGAQIEPLGILPTDAPEADSDFDGVWLLEEAGDENYRIPAAMIGMDMSLVIADGKLTLTIGGADMTNDCYVEDGILFTTQNGAEVRYELTEDGKLLTVQQGTMLWFAREQTAVPETPIAPLSAEDSYLGTWGVSEYVVSGMTISAESLGMTAEENGYVLEAGGIGKILLRGEEVEISWYMKDDVAYIGSGSENDFAFVIRDDGNAILESNDMTMVYVKLDGVAPVPTAQEVIPEEEPEEAFTEIRYVLVKCMTSGYSMDITALGEYSVIFHADGKADFTLSGIPVSGLAWTEEGDEVSLDYPGMEMRFVKTDEGFELNFGGSMLMTFQPENS